MICETIKALREKAGYSQTSLARELNVTRSSVNAWEMGISTPTTQYIISMAKLFHVSTDYLLGQEPTLSIRLEGYTQEETDLIYGLLRYFDSKRTQQ